MILFISVGGGGKGGCSLQFEQKSASLGQIFWKNNRKLGQKVYRKFIAPLNLTSSYAQDTVDRLTFTMSIKYLLFCSTLVLLYEKVRPEQKNSFRPNSKNIENIKAQQEIKKLRYSVKKECI